MPAGRDARADRPQIPALTGLRFFAAFFILFAHSVDWLAQFQDSTVSGGFSFVAMYGMPLFFVLSGFVVHYNYGHLFESQGLRRAVRDFLAARVARLFPLYFSFLLVSILADDFSSKTGGHGGLWVSILGYYATLTQSWFYIVIDGKELINWLFPLSWSISTEWFFYLAYLALAFPILAIRSARVGAIAAVGFGILATLAFVLSRVGLDGILRLSQGVIPNYVGPEQFGESFYRWLFYFSPYCRLAEFVMGALVSQAHILAAPRPVSPGERRTANVLLALCLGLLGLLGAVYTALLQVSALNAYVQHLALNFLCAPAIGYILYYVARYDTAFTRLLSRPTLLALGETSYSIYLVHTWTIGIFNRAAQPLTPFSALETVLRIGAAIALTLLLSYATYRLIEAPGRRWLRSVLSRRGKGEAADHPAPIPTAGRRLGFTAAVVVILAGVAGAGQAAQSPALAKRVHRLFVGDRPEIQIVSATYGMSCKDFKVPAPYPNLVAPGNATSSLKSSCDGQLHCGFLIDASKIGDPANSCGKDFTVEYRCADDGPIKSALVPAEAHGQTVALDCAAPAS